MIAITISKPSLPDRDDVRMIYDNILQEPVTLPRQGVLAATVKYRVHEESALPGAGSF